MNFADLSLVFVAGVAAAFNPCGVAMLPSYVSYLVGGSDEGPEGTAAESRSFVENGMRGAAVGLWMTLGFLAVFVVIGIGLTGTGQALEAFVPYLSVAIGLLLVILGGRMLAGKSLEWNTSRYAHRLTKWIRVDSKSSMFVYGVFYAIVSLGCTLPIFLMLVSQAMLFGQYVVGVLNFIAYALGMGLVVIAISMLAMMSRALVTAKLRQIMPFVTKASAVIIIAAGLYVMYYTLIVGKLI
ncbi:cytochrome c biogenesis CcdA family protein [Alicyclobacillus sp. SP_1]|uniref:cytochrome c biogenesis CcdA family protein n=1 Tax=Alicyclobacillus sp. SP_1 TaxID=2942475 RepID=UPI002157241A|nr:cytochrome c biogenesis CcdA family protein [Alicyclobacillus sp. SP_1]